MVVPTRSSSEPNPRAWGSVVAGALSVAAVPVAIAVTHYRNIDLVAAGWGVVPGLVLGVASLVLGRRASKRTERTIGRVGGRAVTRLGLVLGALGVYLGLAGALSLGVYELLNKLSA